MTVAIMQPYFLPYIAYWQLINAVDTFVLLDDVNYIMRGYINRNNILLNGETYRFSIPINKASQNKLIFDTKLSFSYKERSKLLKTFEMAYSKAKHYKAVSLPLREIVMYDDNDVTAYIEHSIRIVTNYIGIKVNIIRSSSINKDNSTRGQERILEICRQLEADTYINLSGGRSLYNSDDFAANKIKLQFVSPNNAAYKQFGDEFVANLSVLDIMMFCSVTEIQGLLNE